MRPSGFKPKTKTINLIFMNGGVGDHVAALSAVAYMLKTYPWVMPLIWVPDFLKDFAKHLLPDGTQVFKYSEMPGKYEPKRPTKTTEWKGDVSPMKIHCLDYAFLKLLDENPGVEHKNYLQIQPEKIATTEFKLAIPYVVLTTGFTAAVREFTPEAVNKVSNWLNKRGIQPVFLGQRATKTGSMHTIEGAFKAEIDYSVGLDLIDKTSLLQAAKIMGGAKAVIGVDNGLLHVAGCTQVPIIGGFTTVSPEIRMPVRNNVLGWNYYPVVPDKTLACGFCQEKTNFLYGHDYTKCIYKDNLCTTQMTAEKFIANLERALCGR